MAFVNVRMDTGSLLPSTAAVHLHPMKLQNLTASRVASGSAASTSNRIPPPPFTQHAASLPRRRNAPFACAAPDLAATPGLSPAASSSTPGKDFDLVALSNLCVDIVVPMEALPPADEPTRRALLQQLTAHPPPPTSWEVGGNTNTLIAASRLGLRVASVGHIGDDVYGRFLSKVLHDEGVEVIEPVWAGARLTPDQDATLLCFVLVAPDSQHAFCSSYDFGPWPLLSFVETLPRGAERVLDSTAALFINGFVFDEVPTHVVLAAAERARRAGAAIFFDPGPRAWTFSDGARRAALDAVLDASDVVLMTEEEAEAVTGESDGETAARTILARPGARTEWCVIKRGAQGALLAAHPPGTAVYEQRALRVDVSDTVGCGDSFAAAVVLGYTQHAHSIPAVMALASAVGAATAMGSGAGRNVARADDVLSLLRSEVPRCEDGRTADALGVLGESLQGAARRSMESLASREE